MKATFGAGCFWQVEEAFRTVPGVRSTAVGYMGGTMKKPTYEQVCTDMTGHVEVCQVDYNPTKVSYDKLLNIFWKIHDPTQLNRQGVDRGTQYRSVIFYHNESQKKSALHSTSEQQKKYRDTIVTEIKKAATFYPAEEYHQKYLQKKGLKTC